MTEVSLLRDFLLESNRIEGIRRRLLPREIEAAERFLALPTPTVPDMQALVSAFQPDAILRDKPGLDVRVGRYIAPPGGPDIRFGLADILAKKLHETPYYLHVRYEMLHPFTDGNGRSGRMLWLWMMLRRHGSIPEIGFLHCFYYQTLEAQQA